ncbi:hypothetical protein CAPTEDRAFT_186775, partial [Capitella teleta]
MAHHHAKCCISTSSTKYFFSKQTSHSATQKCSGTLSEPIVVGVFILCLSQLPNVPQDEPEEMYEVPTEPSLPLPDLPQQRESNISERPAAVVPQEEEEEEEVAYEEAEN